MYNQIRQSIPKTNKYNNILSNSHIFNKKIDSNLTIIETLKLKSESAEKDKFRKYIKGKLLGKGGFAKCYELICKDNNKIFAAKMLPRNNITTERQRQKLITEIKIHKSLHHPQIVAFEHVFEDKSNVYMLLELCQNQTLNELFERRKTLTEIEVQCYMIQLIKALQYLHSHRVIHRDLKLGNLFLNDKMQLKVGDFGLATKLDFEGERKKTICGTPNYIAPEVLYGTGHSYEVDIWSLGVIIYTLLIGKPPFETRDVKTTYNKIKKADFSFPKNCKVSLEAKNLIKKILILDPKKRPSLNEILSDDFFNQGIAIPKLLPLSTLAIPPPLEYIKKYIPNTRSNEIIHKDHLNGVKMNNASNSGKIISCIDNTKDTEIIDEDLLSNNKNIINIIINNKVVQKKSIYITKWADYSNKHSLGYMLNDGYIGVYFNDTTKMLLNPSHNKFTYIGKKINEEDELLYTFSTKEYPDDLKKKVYIFNQIKNYFDEVNNKIKKDENNTNEKNNEENEEKKRFGKHRHKKDKEEKKLEEDEDVQNVNAAIKNIEELDFIFVKKWIKTKHAFFFRLSNKNIQVCFKDKTEIFLDIKNENVIYTNKKEEKNTYPINKALNSSNYEMNNRVKYIKQVLAYMINSNKIKKINESNSDKK